MYLPECMWYYSSYIELFVTMLACNYSRKKGVYSRDKSKLFLKMNCETGAEGLWKVKVIG